MDRPNNTMNIKHSISILLVAVAFIDSAMAGQLPEAVIQKENFSKLIVGKWQSDSIKVEYLANGIYFYHGSDETNSKVGFDPDTGGIRPTRWRIAGVLLTQDTLSPRRTQRGMEFLLIRDGFTAKIISLTDSLLVMRSTKTGKVFHFSRL